jgi:hypothetical protein
MIRRLFTLSSALSLVLCIASCIFWVHNIGREEAVVFGCGRNLFGAECESGNLRVLVEVGFPEPRPLTHYSHRKDHTDPITWLPEGWPTSGTVYDTPERRLFGRLVYVARAHMDHNIFRADGKGGLTFDPVDPSGSTMKLFAVQDVPLWFAAAAFGLLPSSWMLRHWMSGRRPIGACIHCGYDLRATPDRCPECGAFSPATNGE